MSVLTIIQIALAALQSVLPLVTNNTAYPKIASEIQAAIASLSHAQQQIIDLRELESLRTQKIW